MCCPKCEEKVLEESRFAHGVLSVTVDRGISKVSVVGYMDPSSLLRKFKKNVDKKAGMWPEDKKKESGGGGGSGGKAKADNKVEGGQNKNKANDNNNML